MADDTNKKTTINELLCMRTALAQRQAQLNHLKSDVARRTIWGGGDNKIEEPVYDVREVDKKLTQINRALFKIDSTIKRSNAATSVGIDLDFNDLMSEIK